NTLTTAEQLAQSAEQTHALAQKVIREATLKEARLRALQAKIAPLPEVPSGKEPHPLTQALIPATEIRIPHPSGANITVTMPTNWVTMLVPEGFELHSVSVADLTYDGFYDLKKTNGTSVIYYFTPK